MEDNTGLRTPTNVQSIVIPLRVNDEPLAPTMSDYDGRSDPFRTPSTPSMETFPATSPRDMNLLASESPTSIAGDTAEGHGYAGSLESTGSEHTIYSTPVSVVATMSARPGDVGAGGTSSPFADSVDEMRTRERRSSSSTSRSRRYPLRGVDDSEERQSLWDHQHPSPVEEEGSVQGSGLEPGSEEFASVRLVRPMSRSGSRF